SHQHSHANPWSHSPRTTGERPPDFPGVGSARLRLRLTRHPPAPPPGSRSDSNTLQGYATTRGPPPRGRPSEVGEERRLAGGDRAPSAGRALAAARRFGRGLRALALGPGPALLVGDLVALLDDEQIGEAGHGVGDQVEVLVPVAGLVGERLYLVEGKCGGVAVALPFGQPPELRDPRPASS